MNTLLLSDDPPETAILTVVLQLAGLSTTPSADLERSLRASAQHSADLVFLALRHGNALDQVRYIRTETDALLAVLYSGHDEDAGYQLYEAGADLVVARPYSARLLAAQLRARMRRLDRHTLLTVSDVSLDAVNRAVQIGARLPEHLTDVEFRLLHALMQQPGQAVPFATLMEHVWGYTSDNAAELVRGVISRLRAKIEVDRRNPQYILTIPGTGYQLGPTKPRPAPQPLRKSST